MRSGYPRRVPVGLQAGASVPTRERRRGSNSQRWIGRRTGRAAAVSVRMAAPALPENARAAVCALSLQPLISPHLPCVSHARQDDDCGGLTVQYT